MILNPFLNPFDDRACRVRGKIAVTYGLLIAANAAAWVWALSAFTDRPALLGTALLAYMFGLRHAFDADHIAAIDNVVRKLMQEGKAPYSVGFFFALGHSTIVIFASLVVASTAAALRSEFDLFGHTGGNTGSLLGTVVSSLFLLVIGIANLFILKEIWTTFEGVRHGQLLASEVSGTLAAGSGFVARIFRSLFSIVSRSWQMYPIGFLFALGFDTATEIGLLGISATQATQGTSGWTVLVFPALFTAGMSLMDTTDSVVMTHAYGWAFVNPIRKLWYNLTITAASVVVALFIGGIEALGLIADGLGFDGRFWRIIAALNENLANFGFVVVGIFIASWSISAVVYRIKGYDRLPAERP